MKTTTRWMLAPALALSVACGSEPAVELAEPLICDPSGGGEIVFGYQELPGGRVPMHTAVLAENGRRFLFIDDACNYWVYAQDYDSPAGVWADVRQGRLTSEQLEGVNTDLVRHDWAGFADDLTTGSHGATRSLWLRTRAVRCGPACAEGPLAVAEASVEWIATLSAAGTPVSDLPLRVEVMPYGGVPEHDPIVEWEGSVSLATLMRPIEEASSVRGRPLIDGADADLIRAIREPFRTGEHGSFAAQVLPVSDDGELFWLYARQTIPIEDERGLVRAPEEE